MSEIRYWNGSDGEDLRRNMTRWRQHIILWLETLYFPSHSIISTCVEQREFSFLARFLRSPAIQSFAWQFHRRSDNSKDYTQTCPWVLQLLFATDKCAAATNGRSGQGRNEIDIDSAFRLNFALKLSGAQRTTNDHMWRAWSACTRQCVQQLHRLVISGGKISKDRRPELIALVCTFSSARPKFYEDASFRLTSVSESL